MKLSVVATLYKSEATVEAFIDRASAAAKKVAGDRGDYEIVLVDDGSPDRALGLAVARAKADPHLVVVELSRNFGHHKAMMTGLRHARGDYCFLIDSDLEEDPELLETFWNTLQEEDLDVVYGVQAKRSGALVDRAAARLAYKAFDWLLSAPIPANHVTVRLMRRNYLDGLLAHRETQLVIGGLFVITGFRQKGVAVDKKTKGRTTYSLLRRWRIFLDSITNFSARPLVMIFYLGVAISLIAGFVALWLLLRWAFGGGAVPGWGSVMVSVWLLGGITIFCIGIIGMYLSKVFIETKGRPLTIIRAVHGRADREAS
jgi:putative glycosyltransferase